VSALGDASPKNGTARANALIIGESDPKGRREESSNYCATPALDCAALALSLKVPCHIKKRPTVKCGGPRLPSSGSPNERGDAAWSTGPRSKRHCSTCIRARMLASALVA